MDTVQVNPKDAMALRQRTGLGIMDCKDALAQNGGDMNKAEAWLREKLKGKMDTRTDRPAGQGCVAVCVQPGRASIVEVRSETDFTAKNDEFRAMANDVAKAACDQSGEVKASAAMTARIDELRIKTNENISLGRGVCLQGGNFAQYVHHDARLGVLLQFEGAMPEELATGICQHVAAVIPTPLAVDETGVPADTLAQKKAEAEAEAKASGKPDQIAAKMAEGKLRKFLEEVTLLGQPYVKDDKHSVKQMLPAGVRILKFVRMTVGG
ncbi:MAG: Elongation factor Ts [Planctomycetota bacterium]|jgi:elongation factor Ts|nr:translation elongation factor Ts [Planctomycetota bacterium]